MEKMEQNSRSSFFVGTLTNLPYLVDGAVREGDA